MHKRLRAFLSRTRTTRRRAFLQDRDGTAAVMTVFASTALLGFMAIGVDGAHYYVVKRQLQTATDLAAMAAAAHLDTAASIAASVMVANGFAQADLQVSPGTYVADPTVAPRDRFSTAVSSNAVEVVSTMRETFIFGAVFRSLLPPAEAAVAQAAGDGFSIQTRAVAARQDQVAFTLGTGVAALDAGVLNALLGGLFGTRLSLSLIDYQSLASATVDLFGLGETFATQGLVSGPTYGSFSESVVAQSKLLNALADSVQGNVAASSAFRLMSIDIPPGVSQSLGKLVDFGPAAALRIGPNHPLTGKVSALDLLLAMAMLGGQDHVVTIDLGASIPGLTATRMLLTVGEPAIGRSFLAIGSTGTTLHSAQVRLLLTTQIGGPGLPAGLTLPLYIELAPGTASISSIACSAGAANASSTIEVRPGLADLWLGSVQTSDFGSPASSPVVRRATLASIAGLMRIDALAHENPSTPISVPLSFSASDIKAGTKKTAAAGPSLDSALSSLLDDTQVTVTTLGPTLPQPQTPQLVKAALHASLRPLDDILGRTLSLLGVSLGRASVTVPGVRCGQGILVN